MTGSIARAELAGDWYADLQDKRLAALKADAESLAKGGAMQPDAFSVSGAMQVEERQSIIKEFEWAITELQKTVEELHVRLLPVTRNEPTPMTTSDREIDVSEARSRLHDLHATTGSLRSLISRLEV